MRPIDLTGRRFGRLVVLHENPVPYRSPGGKPTRRWDCQCDCGREITVLQNALTAKRNPTTSCGCARAERQAESGRERRHYRNCVVCGKRFPAPPSSNRVTCSPECSRRRKIDTHTGNGTPWAEGKRAAFRERIAADPDRVERLKAAAKKASDAARASPLSGPFETNLGAKHWILKSPWGEIFEFDNLNKFVRDHPDWFPNSKSAQTALCAAMKCIEGQSSRERQFAQYKGWQPLYSGKKL